MSSARGAFMGIDEAGRGPVLGPLVVCGVVFAEGDRAALARLGLKDSKAYGAGTAARQARKQLAAEIRALAVGVALRTADPAEIDRWVAQGALNHLERKLARSIIEELPAASRIVADGARIFGSLRTAFPQLVAQNRADAQHPEVAAASIVAKDARDDALAALLAPHEEAFGPINGGGYPNAATAAFLAAYFAARRELPPGVRRSWGWPPLRALDPRCGRRLLFS
jgi:ribonuclease HII